jgi:hypothetical protein
VSSVSNTPIITYFVTFFVTPSVTKRESELVIFRTYPMMIWWLLVRAPHAPTTTHPLDFSDEFLGRIGRHRAPVMIIAKIDTTKKEQE